MQVGSWKCGVLGGCPSIVVGYAPRADGVARVVACAAAVAALSSASAVFADETTDGGPVGGTAELGQGIYIGTDIGVSFVSDVKIKDYVPTPGSLEFGTAGVKADVDAGVAWNIDLGYRFNETFALELESGFYRNGFGGFSAGEFQTGIGLSTPITGGDGNFTQIPIFVNGKFDIPLVKREAGSSGGLNLKLGGGVGVVHVGADLSDIQAVGIPGVTAAVDGGSWEFGGQFIAGLGWQLTSAIEIGLEYRLMAVTGANLGLASFNTPLLEPIADIETDSILTQAVQARISFKF
jgi:opacity protein-like surface antigen